MMPAKAPLLRTAALPPAGSLRTLDRLWLAVEVLQAYLPLLRKLRQNDLRAMVAEARSPSRRRVAIEAATEPDTALRLGQIVMQTLAILPTDKRCLIRSLVLLRMLTHRGIDGTVVVGVAVDAAKAFGAHAWIEHQGRPVLPSGGYERLLEL